MIEVPAYLIGPMLVFTGPLAVIPMWLLISGRMVAKR